MEAFYTAATNLSPIVIAFTVVMATAVFYRLHLRVMAHADALEVKFRRDIRHRDNDIRRHLGLPEEPDTGTVPTPEAKAQTNTSTL